MYSISVYKLFALLIFQVSLFAQMFAGTPFTDYSDDIYGNVYQGAQLDFCKNKSKLAQIKKIVQGSEKKLKKLLDEESKLVYGWVGALQQSKKLVKTPLSNWNINEFYKINAKINQFLFKSYEPRRSVQSQWELEDITDPQEMLIKACGRTATGKKLQPHRRTEELFQEQSMEVGFQVNFSNEIKDILYSLIDIFAKAKTEQELQSAQDLMSQFCFACLKIDYRSIALSLKKKSFIFPEPTSAVTQLEQLLYEMKTSKKPSSVKYVVEQAAKLHQEIVRIHPFTEGNKRTARIISNAFLEQHNVSAICYDEASPYVAALIEGLKKKSHKPLVAYMKEKIKLRENKPYDLSK